MDLNKKRVSKAQKFNILSEHIEKGTPVSELARVHGIAPVTIYQWKRKMAEKPKEEPALEEVLKELNKLRKDKSQLLKALGEAQLDIQCLKDLNEFIKKKNESKLLGPLKSSSKKKRNTPK